MNAVVLLIMLGILGSWTAAGVLALHSGSLMSIALFVGAAIVANSPLRRML